MDKDSKLIFEAYNKTKTLNEAIALAAPLLLSLIGGAAVTGGAIYYFQDFFSKSQNPQDLLKVKSLEPKIEDSNKILQLIESANSSQDINKALEASNHSVNVLLSYDTFPTILKIGQNRSKIDKILRTASANQSFNEADLSQLSQLVDVETALVDSLFNEAIKVVDTRDSRTISNLNNAYNQYKKEITVLAEWIKLGDVYLPKGTKRKTGDKALATTGGTPPEPPDDEEKEFLRRQRELANDRAKLEVQKAQEQLKREKIDTLKSRGNLIMTILSFVNPVKWIVGIAIIVIVANVFVYFRERGLKGSVIDFMEWIVRGGIRGGTGRTEEGETSNSGNSNSSSGGYSEY